MIKISGYTATGKLTYDMDAQQDVFKELGKDKYISDFTLWFESNTKDSCTVKSK